MDIKDGLHLQDEILKLSKKVERMELEFHALAVQLARSEERQAGMQRTIVLLAVSLAVSGSGALGAVLYLVTH